MYFLGLFLKAPLQSWGGKNMLNINAQSPKTTETQPTKSAVLGLIRSALGIERGEDDALGLKDMRFIVRCDDSGIMLRDYNIAQRTHHGFRAGTTKELPAYYLEDATFVALLGADNYEKIKRIDEALKNPMWAPFLGRRAYVPSLPVSLGIIYSDDPLETIKSLPLFWNVKDRNLTKTIKISDSLVTGDSNYRESFFDDPLTWNIKQYEYEQRTFSVYYEDYSRSETNVVESTLDQYVRIRERFNQ